MTEFFPSILYILFHYLCRSKYMFGVCVGMLLPFSSLLPIVITQCEKAKGFGHHNIKESIPYTFSAHRSRRTHNCVSILSHHWVIYWLVRHQTNTWTNAGVFSIGPLKRNFDQLLSNCNTYVQENELQNIVLTLMAISYHAQCVYESYEVMCNFEPSSSIYIEVDLTNMSDEVTSIAIEEQR